MNDYEYGWMLIAKKEQGQKEIPGAAHNPRIVEYHGTTTLRANTDEVPWCSSFVNWVMNKSGHRTTRSAAARSWLAYGIEVPIQYGAIAVTTRSGSTSKTAGHVGFVVRYTDTRIWLLGGNQSDTVKISSFPRSILLGCRMPVNYEKLRIPNTKSLIA